MKSFDEYMQQADREYARKQHLLFTFHGGIQQLKRGMMYREYNLEMLKPEYRYSDDVRFAPAANIGQLKFNDKGQVIGGHNMITGFDASPSNKYTKQTLYKKIQPKLTKAIIFFKKHPKLLRLRTATHGYVDLDSLSNYQRKNKLLNQLHINHSLNKHQYANGKAALNESLVRHMTSGLEARANYEGNIPDYDDMGEYGRIASADVSPVIKQPYPKLITSDKKRRMSHAFQDIDWDNTPSQSKALKTINKYWPNQTTNQEAKNEFYVNKATMNPFWTKKLHKPIVNLDAKHRADINRNASYAGKHVMTYVSKNGQMIHTQVISGNDFNRIRRASNHKPLSNNDFITHMNHRAPLASKTSNLVFRAKTFIHKGLNKIRGKSTHFINTASIKASKFKFNIKRELQAEHQTNLVHNSKTRADLVAHTNKPYDAFNYTNPTDLRQLFGDNPKNYKFKQDYMQANRANSPFNTITPKEMDSNPKHYHNWRTKYSHIDIIKYNNKNRVSTINKAQKNKDNGLEL